MNILVTGAAGFIGYHLCELLIKNGHTVIGLDNINDYYDVGLKYARIQQLGIPRAKAEVDGQISSSTLHGEQMKFIKLDLADRQGLDRLFQENTFDVVCNLGAQAGVRYSLENPDAYIQSNVVGFANLLECCRHGNVKHLVYASSSSVYGLNEKIPFSTEDTVDRPISIYAATKKSNELMAHTYSHLYQLPTTGLRFFTVYGPWGRPDMALFLFVDAIKKGKPINVFNYGNMARDFTYVDDIVGGMSKIIETPVAESKRKDELYKIYNIGNNKQVKLTDFIDAIESSLDTPAKRNLMPIQPGDVESTWADVNDLIRDYDYKPDTPIEKGVKEFVDWYNDFYE
ncbi:UDP-glucuronate 4-epimerase [Allomuricauda ruestringensis DSM 13258]|uniref:UDP-glucuronate 4-epimerase n=1 Tax=Allomuricauda ruestringensis (strain DSM 13258 / CIP 107369 / LMG 19739 / B1) TaxID=886377 RepID=G2PNI1_ALLRU|nr:NAD-dependent epimerase [Allomuricauda ruestringensis]AEM71361.1 UDP-glucuronate 4-epimerase [Allomuricauda ruestringensis DSM 13258]